MMNMQHHIFMYGLITAMLVGLGVAAMLFFSRRSSTDRLLVSDIAARNPGFLHQPSMTAEELAAFDDPSAQDTIFILPDISHYTQFMTGNRFAFGHARYVVFSLLNAMIDTATKKVQLSKLEGDAALFFVDSKRLGNSELGQIVIDIFGAFFRERQRLIKSNICRCSACSQIENLDLKIFVHRGRASRFEFRGSIDHFGTDVIILHRMMKNSVRDHRYVMITNAAASCIELPGEFETFTLEEEHDHIGKFSAKVHKINDAMAMSLGHSDNSNSSWLNDLASKLQQNLKTATRFLNRWRPGN